MGITIAQFWNLTFRELQLLNKAWVWNQKQRERQNIIQAWAMAAFTRAKRMPDLGNILRRIDTGDAPPTAEEVESTKRIADEGARILEEKRRLKKKREARK